MPMESLRTIFTTFLRQGLRGWGGPINQIQMIREEVVDQKKWLSPSEFNTVFGLLQALPGPEAVELCIYAGWKRHGRWGGFWAGTAFLLPNLILIFIASWLYVSFARESAAIQAILQGIRPVIVSLVLFSGVKLAAFVLGGGKWRISLSVLSFFLASLTSLNFFLIMLGGGFLYLAVKQSHGKVSPRFFSGMAGVIKGVPFIASFGVVSTLFVSLFMIGTLSFGGAHTVIPLLHDVFVREYGLVTQQEFLDGIAINEIIPGPLVMVAAFIGYLVSGTSGLLLGTLAMFLPAFIIVLGFARYFQRLAEYEPARIFLQGVLAAVMGIFLQFFVALAGKTLIDPFSIALAIFSLFLLHKGKFHPGIIIGIGLFLGAMRWALAGI